MLQVESASLSLPGAREENQDRVAVAITEHAALLLVVDGMGGHADGSLAAETTVNTLMTAFQANAPHQQPLLDPLGFLHLGIGLAHDAVARLGRLLSLEKRPRATCAICLVQQGSAYWAHVGDSRVYWLRNGKVLLRTRDHSHVEQLLREGLINAQQAHTHPMRNYVECCLGGDPVLSEMSIGRRRALRAGDVLLVCSDGIWGGASDAEIALAVADPTHPLQTQLGQLARRAVKTAGRAADNASAAALRFSGD